MVMTIEAVPAVAYVFRARVVRWVDGDTVDLRVALPFHLALGNDDKPARFRLLGVNAWESRAPGGPAATAYADGLAPAGSMVTIRSHLADRPDNFGRWLAEVWAPDGTFINQGLIDGGHAVAYRV